MKSQKLQRVIEFMRAARLAAKPEQQHLQATPTELTIPSFEVRRLRAKLILEEALETIQAMGIDIYVDGSYDGDTLTGDLVGYEDKDICDPVGVADGLGDLEVVALGTYAAFGMDDEEIFSEVHRSNMTKFPAGYNGTQPDGKWKKPPTYSEPKLRDILAMQGLPINHIAYLHGQ
jgi:predicted HAD superfamily Cof-like phosphohydrolase